MSAVQRIGSLLAVQKGRVGRAMAVVNERNRALRELELERDAAHQRWIDAVTAYLVEQESLTQSIAASMAAESPALRAAGLSSAALRCDANRQRVAEAAESLKAAEESVSAASSAAMEARAGYRVTLARQDALLALQESWRKALAGRALRLEEQEV